MLSHFVLVAAGSSGTSLILPATNELIWGSIAFVIVFGVLAKYAFPAASKAVQDRSDKIRSDLEAAEHARQEAAALLESYRAQLAESREEANRIVEEARTRAEQVGVELRRKAEENAQRIVANAERDIAAERDRAMGELRREVGVLAVELASRVVGESLDGERHLRLVDRYIDELAGSADGGDAGA